MLWENGIRQIRLNLVITIQQANNQRLRLTLRLDKRRRQAIKLGLSLYDTV